MFNIREVETLVGKKIPKKISLEPFNSLVCQFLDELSSDLLKSKEIKNYSDLVTFAFYIRKRNLLKIKESLKDNFVRKGKGIIFHVAPSNVPINFAYSFLFSIISGNSNIVRVPTKNFIQIRLICKYLNKILNKKKFITFKESNLFIRYEKNDKISEELSLISDGRMIWGGDKTINEFKNYKTKLKSFDVLFNDKYSISIINSEEILKIKNSSKFVRLVEGFYNDTLLIDQNACSSPQLILWTGKNSDKAQNLFWVSFFEYTRRKYELEDVAISEKFTQYNKDLMQNKNIDSIQNYDNYLFRAKLKKLPLPTEHLKGKWGYFYEIKLKKFSDLKKIINDKFQTVTYFGFDKEYLMYFVENNDFNGIDRIVPIGNALDIGMIWDGYNIKDNLTRIIEIR
jgi:hypothetical protein